MKHILSAIALAGAFVAAVPLPAHATHDASRSPALSDGEIRKVDPEAKKLTIRHGRLDNLGMPAMTMVYQVSDPRMLNNVTVGDKVKFAADKIGGAYTVVHLDPLK